jgi:hypothetical protein
MNFLDFSPPQLQIDALIIAIAGVGLTIFTIVALIKSWGFRFRLVGVTSFTFVVAASVFALSVSLYQRPNIPDAVRYTRIFDRQSNQAVITMAASVTENQIKATLEQAATDLFSSGRTSPDGTLTIRARTILHPQAGLTVPLFLGQVRRSLLTRNDPNMQIELYPNNVALLTAPETLIPGVANAGQPNHL